jgi:hypothetical protein
MADPLPQRLKQQFLMLGLSDDAAQLATEGGRAALAEAALLRLCWETINGWDKPGALKLSPAAERLAAAGGSADDMRLLARSVAYSTLFRLLYLLDEGPNFALREVLKVWEPDFPNWALAVVDEAGEPMETLGGLHAGLRSADPSGREGADILGSPAIE